MLEEAIAQQRAREAELNDARARLAERVPLDRTRIKSPVDAIVERRLISVGDFVSPARPSSPSWQGQPARGAAVPRAPVRAAQARARRHAGPARRPGQTVTGTITEVRPMVGTNKPRG